LQNKGGGLRLLQSDIVSTNFTEGRDALHRFYNFIITKNKIKAKQKPKSISEGADGA